MANSTVVKTEKKKTYKEKFHKIFGFEFDDLTSWNRFVKLMHRPTDPSSLGISRLLFGLLMVSDIPEERGGSNLDLIWGEPRECHFPLFDFLKPFPLPFMGLLYGVMWLGAVGITIGYRFKLSALAFTIPYWYLFLLDKSYWTNHSYLFGIVAIILLVSSSHYYASVDSLLDSSKKDKQVPLWNYFLLRYQFFLMYFLAGLKKFNTEWLDGYSMHHLGTHWVFDPFKLFLNTDQIDYLLIHWFGFIFDLTVGFWLLYDLTRPFAMIICGSFHLMNSRLFSIGMFPYVCLVTMPIFCDVKWPRKIVSFLTKRPISEPEPNENCIYDENNSSDKTPTEPNQIQWKHKLVTCLLLTHCSLQLFLPYSHFITKGYNNWVQGLYGYSWDMMVHNWDTVLIVVKVVDNKTGKEHFLDPSAWTQSDRWYKHGDMCVQYAQCLKRNLLLDMEYDKEDARKMNKKVKLKYITSSDISIYIDVWCSLNKRFQQRMFNPNYDLLQANWSPFQEVEWLMPLLTQYNELRNKIYKLQQEVYSWSNYSDVLFVADFPGLYLENYITPDMSNVTLTVLEGEVYFETVTSPKQSYGLKLRRGASTRVRTGSFHKVHTTSQIPACYMYTYTNKTKEIINENNKVESKMQSSPFPFVEEMHSRIDNIQTTLGIIGNSFLNVVYNVPMVRRIPIY